MKKLKEKLRAFDWRMLFAAAVSLLLGILILIRPDTSALLLGYVLAVIVTVYGTVHTIRFFLAKQPTSPFSAAGLPVGLTVLSLGIYLLVKPETLLAILPIALGCLLIYLGFVSLQTALDLIRKRANLWYVPLIFALVMLVSGLIIYIDPFKAERGRMIFLGIALLLECAMQIASLILMNRKKKLPPTVTVTAPQPTASTVSDTEPKI